MGWSDMDARCKKHPSHRQSKGVCPSCLRERLAQLSAASSSTTTTTTNGSSSSRTSVYLSDSNNSPGAAADGSTSPPTRLNMAALLRARPEEPAPLTKSRSLAFVVAAGGGMEKPNSNGRGEGRGRVASLASAKTKGFWARLMPGKTRRRTDGHGDMAALHSKTVKETASARWVL